jgi:hypothetical protein
VGGVEERTRKKKEREREREAERTKKSTLQFLLSSPVSSLFLFLPLLSVKRTETLGETPIGSAQHAIKTDRKET